MSRIIYAGTDCRTCGRGPMAARWSSVGTGKEVIKHGADGECITCYNLTRYHRKNPTARRYGLPAAADLNYERNKASLEAYLQDRRRRGIPADGTGYIRLAGRWVA